MTWVLRCQGLDELLLVHGGEDDVEGLAEPALHFVLPLDGERRRAEDQHAVDGLAELQFLDEQPGHDGLAGAGIVGQQEPQARLRQHPLVNGLDLVRERADAGKADGELAVVGVGEANAGGLDQQLQVGWLNQADRLGGVRCLRQGRSFVG